MVTAALVILLVSSFSATFAVVPFVDPYSYPYLTNTIDPVTGYVLSGYSTGLDTSLPIVPRIIDPEYTRLRSWANPIYPILPAYLTGRRMEQGDTDTVHDFQKGGFNIGMPRDMSPYHKIQMHKGSGIINEIINHLPIELHIPGYKYCGPGTKKIRQERGDAGINPLDEACKKHDMAYNDKDATKRHEADKILLKTAMERSEAKDANFAEKAAALIVVEGMKIKMKTEKGHKKSL